MTALRLCLAISLISAFSACGDDSAAPLDSARPDSGATDSGDVCGPGEERCAGECTSTASDPDHCGACGNACPSMQVCDDGSCREPMECPAGETDCGDGCTDTSADDLHCGTCRSSCPFGQGCSDGTCMGVCEGSETACEVGGALACVDTSSDPESCGACGMACELGETCEGGACGCPGGTTMCDGSCVDTQTNPAFCGDCDTACGDDGLCVDGSCACSGDLELCDGSCVNTDVDNDNCGACGTSCATPAQTCVGGTCVSACGVGTVECDGSCTNLSVDDDNCGGCGNVCATGTSCSVGRCRPDNDFRTNAAELSWPSDGSEISVTGTTTNAVRDGLTAGCEANGPNVWYRFTITERQPVWVDTAGSDYDTAIYLTNADGMPLRGWCNDDCGCGTTDEFTSSLQSCDHGVLDAGTYYVSVGGFRATSSGDFTLHVQRLDPVGRLFENRLEGDDYTGRERLMGTSASDGACYSAAMSSGEDQYWFAACGGDRETTFSVCPADDNAFFFDPNWEIEYDGRIFDPVMYVRSASNAGEVACNDDNVGVDCFDTRNRMNLGARISGASAQRGLNGVVLDSRTGGSGMRYRMRYVVPELDVSTRR